MKWHRSLMLMVVPCTLLIGAASAPSSTSKPAVSDGGANAWPTTAEADEPEVDAGSTFALDAGTAATAPAVLDTLAKATETNRFLAVPEGSLDALAKRMQEKRDRPLVVVQYGDSHTQAGFLPRELRNQLAAGRPTSPGYVAPGWHNVGDAKCSLSGTWKTENWLKPGDKGSFGPLGTAWVTHDPHAHVNLHLQAPPPEGATVTVFYLRSSHHLPFRIVANGQLLRKVDPAPIAPGDQRMLGYVKVQLPANTADVELDTVPARRAGPELRFFGFLVQYPGAAVEFDALGVQGTAVDHPLTRGDRTIEEYLALRQPDLLVVWYGSNSLVAPNYEPVSYGKTFAAFLARLRAAAPQAARLAIGPPDLARRPSACPTWSSPTVRVRKRVGRHYVFRTVKRKMNATEQARWVKFVCAPEQSVVESSKGPQYPVKGIRSAAQWLDYLQTCQIRTLPAVSTITEAEHDAAQREGFAFFDTFAFMDGAGSIHRWVCQQPQLARFDHVHLTVDGYTTVAQGVWSALQSVLHVQGAQAVHAEQPASAEPALGDDGEGEP